jgi:hypothetical protein
MNEIATAQPAPALGQKAEQASEVALHQSSDPKENRFYREPEQPASGMLAIIARAASDPAVNVEKMQALLAMNERIEAKQAQAEFAAAFARLAGKLPTIKKDGTVAYDDKQGNKRPAFKFARWEDIMRAIKPDLDAEGFALTFKCQPRQGDGGGLLVTGKLIHVGGHTEEASMPLPLDSSGGKNNLQGYGSTFSYGKRYTATMLLNIVTEGEDDDGVKGGQEFINDDTVAAINAELVKRKVNVDAFLDFLGVKSVTEIQVKDLAKARNAIKVAKPMPPTELPR